MKLFIMQFSLFQVFILLLLLLLSVLQISPRLLFSITTAVISSLHLFPADVVVFDPNSTENLLQLN
jgi:hypothetical protein